MTHRQRDGHVRHGEKAVIGKATREATEIN